MCAYFPFPNKSYISGVLLIIAISFVFCSCLFLANHTHATFPSVNCSTTIHRIRVFDCFIYSSESLTLFIRLRTLSQVVTAFILGHSNVTFSGKHSRPLTYEPYENEIRQFSAQIYPIWFDMTTVDANPWHRAIT
jgi:hypothetical protein